MKTNQKKTKKRKKRGYKLDFKKLAKFTFYGILTIVYFYVIFDRMKDITSIKFFFTTWQ